MKSSACESRVGGSRSLLPSHDRLISIEWLERQLFIRQENTMVDECGSVSRRKLLLAGLLSSIAATAGVVLYPVVRFLWPRKSAMVSGALEVVAPYRVNELRPDAEGEWPSPFEFDGKPCLLIKTTDGEVKAFNAICTHVDCTVAFLPEGGGKIFCACHNGVYDLNGRNVSGPPPRPLETYTVTLRGEEGQEEIIVSHS